jgi:hypothetical protein
MEIYMKFSKLVLVTSLVAVQSFAFAQSTATSAAKKVITINEGNPIVRTQDTYNFPKVTPRFINTMAVPTIGYVDGANTTSFKANVNDLTSLTSGVRQALAKNGYSVLETKATDMKIANASTSDARVADAVANMAGNYANAAFVLVGTVTNVSEATTDTSIYGEDKQLVNKGFKSTVHFDVVDHDSQKVVKSFDANGTGLDSTTAKGSNRAAVITSASNSLGADVVRKLKVAGINPNNSEIKVIGKDAPAPTTFMEPVPATSAPMKK